MAQSEVIRKLNERLTRLPITEEETAVYVLTQIRKLLEFDLAQRQEYAKRLGQAPAPSVYPTLGFYCNWAVHTSLDKTPAQEFMNKVMSILTLNGSHAEVEHRELDSLLTMQSFRDELHRFLVANNIYDALCTDENNWGRFLDAYSRVVHDTKLVLKGNPGPIGPLKLAVETVTIEAVPGVGFAPGRPFPMNWMVNYADGRKARLEFSQHGLLGATVTFV